MSEAQLRPALDGRAGAGYRPARRAGPGAVAHLIGSKLPPSAPSPDRLAAAACCPMLIAPFLLVLALLATPAQAAPVEDSIAQRAQACTLCHGKEGRAA